MDDFEIELEKFINWFASVEEIPGETRIDFLNHIIQTGYMDEKAENFIEDALNHLVKVSQKEADELKYRLELLEDAITGQEDPELSLAEQVLRDAEYKINNLAGELREEFAEFEKEKTKKEENTEKEKSNTKAAQVKKEI